MTDLARQDWYWLPDWQRGEQEADQQIAAGNLEVFDNMGDMFAALNVDLYTGEQLEQGRSND